MRTTFLALLVAFLLPACGEDADPEFQTGAPPSMSPPTQGMMGPDGGEFDGGLDSGIPGDGGGLGVDAGGGEDASFQIDGGGGEDAGIDPGP